MWLLCSTHSNIFLIVKWIHNVSTFIFHQNEQFSNISVYKISLCLLISYHSPFSIKLKASISERLFICQLSLRVSNFERSKEKERKMKCGYFLAHILTYSRVPNKRAARLFNSGQFFLPTCFYQELNLFPFLRNCKIK